VFSTDKTTKLTTLDKFKQGVSKLLVEEEKPPEVVSELRRANIAAFEEELKEIRSKGIVDFFFLFVSIFSGAVCMMWIEGWPFADAIYWGCVTVSGFLLFSCLVLFLFFRSGNNCWLW
jgi:hypothetical protein